MNKVRPLCFWTPKKNFFLGPASTDIISFRSLSEWPQRTPDSAFYTKKLICSSRTGVHWAVKIWSRAINYEKVTVRTVNNSNRSRSDCAQCKRTDPFFLTATKANVTPILKCKEEPVLFWKNKVMNLLSFISNTY